MVEIKPVIGEDDPERLVGSELVILVIFLTQLGTNQETDYTPILIGVVLSERVGIHGVSEPREIGDFTTLLLCNQRVDSGASVSLASTNLAVEGKQELSLRG